MGHLGQAFLFGLLVGCLKVADVGLHGDVLVLLHCHELPDVLAHVSEVVLGELAVHEVHEPLPSGLVIGGSSCDSGNALFRIGLNCCNWRIWVKIDGKNLLSDS